MNIKIKYVIKFRKLVSHVTRYYYYFRNISVEQILFILFKFFARKTLRKFETMTERLRSSINYLNDSF